MLYIIMQREKYYLLGTQIFHLISNNYSFPLKVESSSLDPIK